MNVYTIVEITGNIAIVGDGEWCCENPVLEELLNLAYKPSGSPSDPQPCSNAARRAIEDLGGKIIEEKLQYNRPGAIY